jgi:hypothetical protein
MYGSSELLFQEGRGKKLGYRFHQVSALFIKEDLKSTNLRYRDQ